MRGSAKSAPSIPTDLLGSAAFTTEPEGNVEPGGMTQARKNRFPDDPPTSRIREVSGKRSCARTGTVCRAKCCRQPNLLGRRGIALIGKMQIPSYEERILFWQQAYARAAFIEADRYIARIIERDPPLGSLDRKSLTTALVSAYGRPFKQRRAVRLSEDAVPAEHRNTHDSIIEMRDKIIAHRDLDGPVTEWGFVSEIRVDIVAGEMAINTRSPFISNETAHAARPLLAHLITVADRTIDAFVRQFIWTSVTPEDASYVVSLEEDPEHWLQREVSEPPAR